MRLPITSTVQYKIVSALKHTVSTRYEQILFRAMLTLAYHALLRVGEMTVNNNKHEHVLQLSQITLSHDTVVVYFLDFKHSAGKSFRLQIVKNKNAAIYAVKSLQEYLSIRSNKEGPLFVNANGQAICRQAFQTSLNRALVFCGMSSKQYKPHSFRIGFTTDANSKGLSNERIKSLGRWKSDAFKLYVRQSGQISDICV